MRDLVLLVPDKNTEFTVRGALSRPASLGIREVDYSVLVDQGRDGGVRRRGTKILGVERRRFAHALMMFDYEGSGASTSALELEASLDATLSDVWQDRAKAIVIEPEVDVWIWGSDTHIRAAVGWSFPEGVREWLATSEAFEFDAVGKPLRPKEAFQAVCRRAQVPRSSANYAAITERLSLTKCQDPAFQRLASTARAWFGLRDGA